MKHADLSAHGYKVQGVRLSTRRRAKSSCRRIKNKQTLIGALKSRGGSAFKSPATGFCAPVIKVHAEVKHLGPDHLARIKAAVKKAHGSYVTVGFPADKKYPGEDVSVAQVALFNEFGTYTADGRPHVPARPFMRPAIDEGKAELERQRIDSITKVAFMGVGIEQALFDMGNVAKAMIVAKINSNVPPPNAPSTIARKLAKGHGEQTLIDSGLMRDSIEVQVVLSQPLKDEKAQELKLKEQREHSQAERAAKRQAYRKEAQAALKARRDAKSAQKNAQKTIAKQTKKAGKAVKKAGKSVKRLATKTQKAVRKNIKKAVVQTTKTVKQAVKSRGSGIKKSAGRIRAAKKPKGI